MKEIGFENWLRAVDKFIEAWLWVSVADLDGLWNWREAFDNNITPVRAAEDFLEEVVDNLSVKVSVIHLY